MCGRLACGLKPDEVRNCCCYKKPGDDEFVKPIWKDAYNNGKSYSPSCNICPTEVAPVLMSGAHFDSESRMIAPMIFGVIPSWTKDHTSKYSTINCRIEHIKTSKLYGPLLQKGQRCIVICNGFYEWKKESNQCSKPYFIYTEQINNVLMDDPSTWNLEFENQIDSKGLKPLKLAALFETQILETGEEVFSFTIITKESSSKMSWLHLRMPAIIDTEEQLQVWLNHKEFNGDQALQSLNQFENLICYPVATTLNKTVNKDVSCLKKSIELEANKKTNGSSNFLKKWLAKRPRDLEDSKEEKEENKISKIRKD